MQVESGGFRDGRIADEYGSKGTEFGAGGMPALSFPVKITGAPPGTASFAVVFDDPDSVPVCGFKWVHWLVAGLREPYLEEDASRNNGEIVQGANSWEGRGTDRAGASAYGGPAPPDGEHTYVLTVLALDFEPVLRNGFRYEDLMKVVGSGHTLAKASIKGTYSPKDRGSPYLQLLSYWTGSISEGWLKRKTTHPGVRPNGPKLTSSRPSPSPSMDLPTDVPLSNPILQRRRLDTPPRPTWSAGSTTRAPEASGSRRKTRSSGCPTPPLTITPRRGAGSCFISQR